MESLQMKLAELRKAFMACKSADEESLILHSAELLVNDASMDGRIKDGEYNEIFGGIQDWNLVKSGLALYN